MSDGNGIKVPLNATSIGVFLTLLAQIVTGLYFVLSLSGDIRVLSVEVKHLKSEMKEVKATLKELTTEK